jgi:hypothetical protein
VGPKFTTLEAAESVVQLTVAAVDEGATETALITGGAPVDVGVVLRK